jgi:hypothetical protein
MSYTDISGTPLEIVLTYRHVDDPTNTTINLQESAAAIIRGVVIGLLPQSAQQFLQQPLDAQFASLWATQQASISTLVQNAVLSADSTVTNIQVTVPSSGTLRAEVGGLSPALVATLPPNTPGQQLTLSYQVPGFKVSFDEHPSNIAGLLSNVFGPVTAWVTFDGEVEVAIAVPSDPRIPLGLAIEFLTHNTQTGGNVLAGLSQLEGVITAGLNGEPPAPPPSDEIVPVSSSALGGLAGQITQLSQGLTAAAGMGFLQLAPEIVTDPSSGNAAVAIHLTHGPDANHVFDPGPTLRDASVIAGPSFTHPQIGVATPTVNAGGQVAVTGTYFVPAHATQLSVEWNDTTTGTVAQSEVEWGAYSSAPTTPPGAPPQQNDDVYSRHVGDDGNVFTTPAKMILSPSTWYGFRARDYDVPNLVATDWSAWFALQTAASDQVELKLYYANTSSVVGAGVLDAQGNLAAVISIPAAVPPSPPNQPYMLWAEQGGQQLAYTVLNVVASNAAIPAVLEVLNPNTKAPFPGLASVEVGFSVAMTGAGFAPGPLTLAIDAVGGAVLATPTVAADGTFQTSAVWPNVAGSHSIIARDSKGAQASGAVFAQLPAQ